MVYHVYMDMTGWVVIANEFPRVPSQDGGNPRGTSIPAFADDMKKVGYIEKGVPMIVIQDTRGVLVRVMGPVGPVWVMKKDVKQL